MDNRACRKSVGTGAGVVIGGVLGGLAGQTAVKNFINSLPTREQIWLLEHKDFLNSPPEVIGYLQRADHPIGDIFQGKLCFAKDTGILTEDSGLVPIFQISVGDIVLAFDPSRSSGRASLVSRRVTRLFQNITTEWVVLNWEENGETRELTCTPGHHFLDEFGSFPTIEALLNRSGGDSATIVLADGRLQRVSARRVVYSAETAHLYERASKLETPVVGGLALAPVIVEGWATYKFEVEDLHTDVAGGVTHHHLGAAAHVPPKGSPPKREKGGALRHRPSLNSNP